MTQLFSVEGKTVLVTGGSRGIGLMIAQGFVRAGAHVIISSRKADVCEAVAKELSAEGRCEAIPADLGDDSGAEALAAAVRERFGRLDVLVNNAGATWGAPLEGYPEAAFDKLWAVNVKAVFRLTTALLPALRAAASADDPARVINIGSIDGIRVPWMEVYAYSATKAAVHMLTRSLAHQLASEQITVNAIAPGPFESKMMAFALDDPESRAAIEQQVPLGRIGRPEDMAGTAIYLSSRAGAYLTGAVIPVDGGITTHG
ncbi:MULTISPECIES: glucose 1-dehydrogenase [Micromonospora]|uniref:Glucose 1-dehydrogenase n=1 Tax=Micromonospora zamorensis TaxID=709883 RepID=A0ABZ1P7A2_9ACTN|nr:MULTISPECIES: glucose 1-dehydrogenase [Micromonospora]MBQ0978278.1 glucose 1-dehydrogenase [Micromonospora sp. M61]TQJ21267.1 NAD(P)-dependent dehydrogenase (short-subunit alcohol dehydrogenase family) [Micromonospora sp. A202]WSK47387.1 glucose 1-dehydrogenase [Micromonospora zamorensis]WTE89900.1 glucose 1-dehydrogenase [Micromonospora zamorensis]WTI18727.1 glucose 1-dehydrogenase [Micromonospora zamorensis]